MNSAAFFDGLLALVAFWLAAVPGRRCTAVRLAALLLGCAATLGSLRFYGVPGLVELHQFASALGAAVALPLLGSVALWPAGVLAQQRRYAWIFVVTAAALCVVVVVVAGIKLWASAWALLSAVAMLLVAMRRAQWWSAGAALFMLSGFAAFVGQLQALTLQPGDFLHIGMAIGLLLYGRACAQLFANKWPLTRPYGRKAA